MSITALDSRRPATAPKRAVLYLRQSTYREESISLELQETAGRTYAQQQGYEVVAVESDPGISGRTWQRPAVQRVMSMIETRSADVIIVWKWSRLSRSRRDWAIAIDRIESLGGALESATEPIDTSTASGRFARGMLAEFAAFESERIGEQWKEAHARRRRLGLPASGGARYGYDLNPDGTYTPNEDGQILAECYRRHIDGHGFTRITGWLNSNGILTRAGNPWTRGSITHVLDTGFGAGKIVQFAKPRGKTNWNIRHATFHDGAHEPVIDSATWDAYVAKRLNQPEGAPAVIEPKYILSGLIHCGECGASMHVGNAGMRDYKCSRAAQTQTVRGMFIRRELVEQRIREWVSELSTDLEQFAQLELQREQAQIVRLDTVAMLDRKIAELKDQLGRITVRWSSGKMLDAAYDSAAVQIGAELDALAERRRTAAPAAPSMIDPRGLIVDLAADWDELSVFARRQMLGALIRDVRIHRPPRPGIGVWRERIEIVPVWE